MDKLKNLLNEELDSCLAKMPEGRKSASSFLSRLIFVQKNAKELESKLIKVCLNFQNENELQMNNEEFKILINTYLKKFFLSVNN